MRKKLVIGAVIIAVLAAVVVPWTLYNRVSAEKADITQQAEDTFRSMALQNTFAARYGPQNLIGIVAKPDTYLFAWDVVGDDGVTTRHFAVLVDGIFVEAESLVIPAEDIVTTQPTEE